MKAREIRKYWKEERDAKVTIHPVGSHRSISAHNFQEMPREEEYVEHQGGTPASEEAYRKQVVHCKCLPCPIYD